MCYVFLAQFEESCLISKKTNGIQDVEHSHCVVVANIDRVPQAEHGVSQASEVRLPISEVCGRLLQPLREPLSVLCRLAVGVRGHKKHAHGPAAALHGKEITADEQD